MDLCTYKTFSSLRKWPNEIKIIKYFYCRRFSSFNYFRFLALYKFTLVAGEGWGNFTPCWFFVNNSETIKAETLAFGSIHISLETFVSTFVVLTRPNLQIFSKTETDRYFQFLNFWSIPYKKIVVNPEPMMILTWNLDQSLNLTRETKQRQKMTITSCRKIMMSLSFFLFMANLKQLKNLKTYIFIYLTKSENRTKKSLT